LNTSKQRNKSCEKFENGISGKSWIGPQCGKLQFPNLPIQNFKIDLCFKNYFKIAFRNLLRNKAFSFINIAGLAIGMASAMLILLWIQNEMSHDNFHEKIGRLYTMNNRDKFNGELWAWNTTQNSWPHFKTGLSRSGRFHQKK
jgi:hypothetical protein